MISSGLTRFNCAVSRASTGVDSYGRRVTTFTSVGSMRCDIREGQPTEQPYVDGVAVIAAYELRTRWPNIARLTVSPLDRITARGKLLRITGIRNLDQKNRVAVIDCVEVA